MRGVALLLCLTVAGSSVARADDDPAPLHFAQPAKLTAASGVVIDLPPGYCVTDRQWSALDAAIITAQNDRTRLAAENASLKQTAASNGQTLALVGGGALLVGVIVGLVLPGLLHK